MRPWWHPQPQRGRREEEVPPAGAAAAAAAWQTPASLRRALGAAPQASEIPRDRRVLHCGLLLLLPRMLGREWAGLCRDPAPLLGAGPDGFTARGKRAERPPPPTRTGTGYAAQITHTDAAGGARAPDPAAVSGAPERSDAGAPAAAGAGAEARRDVRSRCCGAAPRRGAPLPLRDSEAPLPVLPPSAPPAPAPRAAARARVVVQAPRELQQQQRRDRGAWIASPLSHRPTRTSSSRAVLAISASPSAPPALAAWSEGPRCWPAGRVVSRGGAVRSDAQGGAEGGPLRGAPAPSRRRWRGGPPPPAAGRCAARLWRSPEPREHTRVCAGAHRVNHGDPCYAPTPPAALARRTCASASRSAVVTSSTAVASSEARRSSARTRAADSAAAAVAASLACCLAVRAAFSSETAASVQVGCGM